MKCPNCNGESTGRFCPYCGSEMPKEQTASTVNGDVIINNYYSSIKDDDEETEIVGIDKIARDIVGKYDSSQKVLMIKELREQTGLGLKEAKDLIEKYLRNINDFNYSKNKWNTYDKIYREEEMREKAREELARKKAYEESKRQGKGCLITLAFWGIVILFIFLKISSCNNEIEESKIQYPKENEKIISIENKERFLNKCDEGAKGKWYEITGYVNKYTDSKIEIMTDDSYGAYGEHFSLYFNEDVDLSTVKTGDKVVVIGKLSMSGNSSVIFENCYFK